MKTETANRRCQRFSSGVPEDAKNQPATRSSDGASTPSAKEMKESLVPPRRSSADQNQDALNRLQAGFRTSVSVSLHGYSNRRAQRSHLHLLPDKAEGQTADISEIKETSDASQRSSRCRKMELSRPPRSRDRLPTHLDPFSVFWPGETQHPNTVQPPPDVTSHRSGPEMNILICAGGQRDVRDTSGPFISFRLRTKDRQTTRCRTGSLDPRQHVI